MKTNLNPRDLAVDLLGRSVCSVQVAAVIYDDYGIFAWGWNSAGNGFGEHAEAHAIRRANRRRLAGAMIAVAGRRKKSGQFVYSKPCSKCLKKIAVVGLTYEYRDKEGWAM